MADTLATIVTILGSWDSDNTNSITPTISKIFTKKRVGGISSTKTYVGVYLPMGSSWEPIDFGFNTNSRLEHVTIDIRTRESYAHLINCKDEAIRLINGSRKTASGFDVVKVREDKDASDGTRNFWRWTIELDCIVYAEAVST